jgi:hypothetical protein
MAHFNGVSLHIPACSPNASSFAFSVWCPLSRFIQVAKQALMPSLDDIGHPPYSVFNQRPRLYSNRDIQWRIRLLQRPGVYMQEAR